MLAEILRMVLEYLGTGDPTGQLMRRVGSSRSAVRAIGARLPWTGDRTPSLNIPGSTARRQMTDRPSTSHLPDDVEAGVPTFADVGWNYVDESRHATDPDSDAFYLPEDDVIEEDEEVCLELDSDNANKPDDPNAMAKISALEMELANLRAQLAQVVKHQETPSPPCASEGVATPACPAVAPPPPPPPPPPGLITPDQINVIDQIRRSRAARKGEAVKDPAASDGALDMGQVIKQMGSVKLRSVQRSPGGTPIRQKPLSDANDPATIIANALQRKFARYNLSPGGPVDDDSDSENQENHTPTWGAETAKVKLARRIISPRRKMSTSPRTSRQPFGQHMLRSASDR